MKYFTAISAMLCAAMLCWSAPSGAQTRADVRLGELVSSGDVFALEREYPQLRDSVSIGMLDLLARAQTGVGFNRLEEAALALDSLLMFHQQELGQEAVLSLSALRAMNLLNLGLYRAAGEAGGDLVSALRGLVPFEELYSFVFIERVGEALADVPAPVLERPDGDVEVPMKIGDVGRGKHLYIPVEVNGVTKDFIFDTGCSFGNFVSEAYAQQAGLRIVADSIPVSGMSVGFVKLAVADSMKVGDLVYRWPVFMVAPPDPELDSLFAFDGVLGYNFIRDAGEIVIDSREGRFVFPAQRRQCGVNMALSSNVPVLKVECLSKEWTMVFDSGNVKSDLGAEFAEAFPDLVAGLERHPVRRGGFGGVAQGEAVTLDSLAVGVHGTDVVLEDVDVVVGVPEGLRLFGGSLGADFVTGAGRMTLSYDGMFVVVD